MSNLVKKLFKYAFNADYRFGINSNRGGYKNMPDEEFLKRKFKIKMGKELNLDDPKTFNEKLQWLKLYDRDPRYIVFVDKYLVRDHIAKTIGAEYLIPLIGVWDDPDEIDFDELPDKFVLKCNHNSGLGMCICTDKSKLNIEKVKAELRQGIKQDYYLTGREWPYKNVPRKIIAEKFMQDDSNDAENKAGLTDYKFFCFNGNVDCVMVCIDRHLNDTKFYFFDEDWKLKRLNKRGKAAPEGFTLPKPDCMGKMFDIARKLSQNIPFVRVDLYSCNNRIYFGEMTFFPDSGFDANLLAETDEYFGNLLDLNSKATENN